MINISNSEVNMIYVIFTNNYNLNSYKITDVCDIVQMNTKY